MWLPKGAFEPRRYRPGGIGNWSGHLPFANDLIAAARPELLVELGTHYGESYFGFCQAIDENNVSCRCYAVDTWLGEKHAGFYDESVFQDVSAHNDLHYAPFSFLLRTTFDEARGQFSPNSIDLLHIDGLHTYNAVLHDFDNWFEAVKPGGMVLLHDVSARHADFGVWKLWEDLASRGECFTFIHSWGLGVFRKPGPELTSPFLAALFSGSEEQRNHIQYFYSLCARNLEYKYLNSTATRPILSETALIQVYPEGLTGFSPQMVYETTVATKHWQHTLVDLTSGTIQGGIRIDIAESPAVIDVAGITVRRGVDNEPVYQATGADQLSALQTGGDLNRIEYRENKEFCRYISVNSDPQLFLRLQPEITDQPLLVELWVRVDYEVTALLPWLQKLLAQSALDLESPREDDLAQVDHGVEIQTPLVADLKRQINELELQRGELQRELDALRKENDTANTAVRRAQSEAYVTKRDLTQAHIDLMQAHTESEKFQVEITSIASSRDEAVHQRNCVSLSLSETQRALAAAESSRDDAVHQRNCTSANLFDTQEALTAAETSKLHVTHQLNLTNAELLQAQKDLTALASQQTELEKTLKAVLSSRSWSVTAPMRKLMEKQRAV